MRNWLNVKQLCFGYVTAFAHALCRACVAATLFALAALCAAPSRGQQPDFKPQQSIHSPILTEPPDANAQMQMREQQVKRASFDAANTERKRQLSEDSDKLLKLATELKAAVDKTTKDTLSLSVIRKAEEIEQLAHAVQQKMKLTIGAN